MCVCTHVSVAQILASLIYLLNNDEFSTGKSASFPKFAAFGQTPELCRRRYATDFVQFLISLFEVIILASWLIFKNTFQSTAVIYEVNDAAFTFSTKMLAMLG